jgi:hypothetical protein
LIVYYFTLCFRGILNPLCDYIAGTFLS